MFLPYHYDAATFLTDLRDVTMAYVVNSTYAAPVTGRQFRAIFPLFTGTGLVAEARLFAVLYLSQNLHGDFTTFVQQLKIQLVNSGMVGEVSLSDLKIWALKLLSHPRGIQVLNDIYDAFNFEEHAALNPAELVSSNQVHFFSSPDAQMYGFSGIGSIFINLDSLQQAYLKLKKKQEDWELEDKECFSFQTKMLVAVIGFHEAAHLAIRRLTNNASESSFREVSMKFSYIPRLDVGIIAQIRLFDLPLLDWETGISYETRIVRDLFKWFQMGPTEGLVAPPSLETARLSGASHEYIFDGIYKKLPPIPFR